MHQPDFMSIHGVELQLDNVINKSMIAPKQARALRDTFRSNEPFPHLVLENLFSPVLLDLMSADFEQLDWNDWRRYDDPDQRKLGTRSYARFGHATQLYFNTIHSGPFVEFLQNVSGVEALVPDPELINGGLHQIPHGGKFGVHTDFHKHPETNLDNRLVFITYLNRGWLPSYGGALELWSVDDDQCKVEVPPVFGRSVLMYQSARSLHGHPDPVCAPDQRTRRSAAAFFYSNGRPEPMPPTTFHYRVKPSDRDRIVGAIKYVVPPILVDAARRIGGLARRRAA